MFFHRGVFIIAIFFYEVMDEACRATDGCIADRSCYT